MKVGILGTGMVGRILAEKIAASGDQVMLGTRNVEDTLAKTETDAMGNGPLKEWLAAHPAVTLGTFADAAAHGEVLYIATFGNVATAAIEQAGLANFTGKVVIDTTNPLDLSQGFPPKFTGTPDNALGEQIQKLLPQAKVVKAFNTLSLQLVVNPRWEEGTPTLFIAGDDASAKEQVTAIAQQWGWQDVVDYGGISQSFWLEAYGMFWTQYAFNTGSWTHAFQLLRK